MPEQRNPYKGSPARPWIRLAVVSEQGRRREIHAFVDTGSPCALIVSLDVLDEFNFGILRGISTNFGSLESGWLRVEVSEIEFEEEIVGYGGDAVIATARSSHPMFEALVGLPLLRMMQYGGDKNIFWIRK